MTTTVFTGPSLGPDEVRRLLPGVQVLPPARRGDLYAVREAGSGRLLIIDGTFSHTLAISPREVIEVTSDGAEVIGASSMGAIRAAECHPMGTRGIGAIYRAYRAGILTSDDAVAVTTNPDDNYAAVSVALVNVHAAATQLRGRGLLSASEAVALKKAAAETFFADRSWPHLLRQAGIGDRGGLLETACRRVDLKRRDALRAVRFVAGLAAAVPSPHTTAFTRPVRYTGHDPLLGNDSRTAGEELVRWLFGSGRYQKYVWPLVVGEPEFARSPGAQDRPHQLRERLATTLARVLRDTRLIADRLVCELTFLEEFETELMQWHAVRRVAGLKKAEGVEPGDKLIRRTRESLAIAHGYEDWRSLASDSTDGKVFGAIPLTWIEEACANLSLARA
ncbi:TfuA-like protein [Amycolatopsis pithecellobii]|uniref:TfuA-like protein n=1 Tax=Amycolatopsis pithecellobii TaxID=664692 RepID=UPI0012B853B7|nr:TfuA-like protein [Amycolatopsis pithecellobii]